MRAGWKGHEKIADGCFDKLKEGEPFFVLRGQDKFAPALVVAWIELAKEYGVDADKIVEAMRCADDMRRWPDRKFPD